MPDKSLPALMRLFPSLEPLADEAERAKWTPNDLQTFVRVRGSGSGANQAANFVASCIEGSFVTFSTSFAISKWDAAHRQGFRRAAALMAGN